MSLPGALYAVLIAWAACIGALLACALAVRSSRSAWRAAREVRSMHSIQAELVELTDSVNKIAGTVKRISGREAVREHYQRKTQAEPDLGTVTDKRELRKLVGITPGKPAPHK